jgi:acyl-CoA thioesterase
MLRAAMAEVDQPRRRVRSITTHFLSPPATREVLIRVRIERHGRSLSTMSVSLSQDEQQKAMALVTCSEDFPSSIEWSQAPSEAPMPDEVDILSLPVPPAPSVFAQIEMRPAFGPLLLSGADEAVTGGWLRLRQSTAVDAPLLAFFSDAWWPSAFGRLSALSATPTIALMTHFHHVPPDPSAFVLARFEAPVSMDGFSAEDGSIWSAEGDLLARSRQLAVLKA